MTVIQAILLGIVEGITEFLPVSSTGHLILVSQISHLAQTDFLKSFEIIIQLGAIASVIVLYWKSFLNLTIIKKLVVAFLPTALVGFTLYRVVKTYFLGNNAIVLWALFIGGIVLIVFELLHKEKDTATEDVHSISYSQSFFVGLFQSVALIPGVSRSAATILGGLLLGLKRKTIVEFSFLLAVPTMLAASGLDLYKNASTFSLNEAGILAVGFFSAFLVAMASIKFFLGFVQKHDFVPFGIYRILVALLFWFIIF
ncbi:MAG: undecaprenyl-diphosphate phosphatase [Patescibacteria group bacterium]|nr:undecaprenyl-diphosphate phosphatase [bacterium]MDZ4241092.1 undecaprenyl-diphosphate phosphatase [Patescibacteria group bacterium]